MKKKKGIEILDWKIWKIEPHKSHVLFAKLGLAGLFRRIKIVRIDFSEDTSVVEKCISNEVDG